MARVWRWLRGGRIGREELSRFLSLPPPRLPCVYPHTLRSSPPPPAISLSSPSIFSAISGSCCQLPKGSGKEERRSNLTVKTFASHHDRSTMSCQSFSHNIHPVSSTNMLNQLWRCGPSRNFSDASSTGSSESAHIEWSATFDEKIKAIIQDCQALEEELCQNPSSERQAQIGNHVHVVIDDAAAIERLTTGKVLSSSQKIRQCGNELLGCYSDRTELESILSSPSEDEETKMEFRKELTSVKSEGSCNVLMGLQVEERINILRNVLTPLLIPRDPDDQCDVLLEEIFLSWWCLVVTGKQQVRAAAGGSEASLFAFEMFQMYQLYSQRLDPCPPHPDLLLPSKVFTS
eukprot:242912-Hanusia_phi.AAC.1